MHRIAVLLVLSLAGGAVGFSIPTIVASNGVRARSVVMSFSIPAWASGKVVNGWRGDPELRNEAEEAFRKNCPPRAFEVSSDPALWEDNDFAPYSGEWKMSGFDRVVQLPTYMQLKFAAKLVLTTPGADTFEVADNGMSNMGDAWVVFGYINRKQRVIKSVDGSSFGMWYVQTLEPDATEGVLKYEMMPSSGSGYMLEYTR